MGAARRSEADGGWPPLVDHDWRAKPLEASHCGWPKKRRVQLAKSDRDGALKRNSWSERWLPVEGGTLDDVGAKSQVVHYNG
jgi:hypothetical protein